MFVRPAIVPNAALSITSQTTPSPASIAVATTDGLLPNAPSPISATTARSGCASLTPSAAAGPNPIVARPLGVMNVPGHGDRELLADAVLVPADVGDDEAVFGHRLAQLAEDALGTHRVLARAVLVGPVGGEGAAPVARSPARSAAAVAVLHALRRGGASAAQRQLRVGDDAELGREVAADLGDVGVDVDQARRRDVEREARIPRARVRLGEPGADGEDDVGGAALLVGDRRAPEAGHAEQQRVIFAHDALAHQRVRDRQLERFGQRQRAPPTRAPRARRRRRRAPGRSAAASAVDDPRRRRRRRSTGGAISAGTLLKASTGRLAEKMSIGTSTSTGPGRPVCARWNARSMMRGRSRACSTR